MNTIKRAWRTFKAMTAMTFPRASSYFFGWAEVGQGEYAQRVGDGLDQNVLVAPLLWIARAFPEAPLSVRIEDEKGKRTVLRRHKMVKLVARPNQFYSGDVLWFGVILSVLTDGNGYVAKVRGASNQVAELWYLPHWMVEPVGSESVFISHYEYRPGARVKRIEVADMIHFRLGIDPRNPRKGFSTLKALIALLFSDSEASNLCAALLKNKGVPGLVISPEKDAVINPEDEPAIKEAVKDKTTGSKRGEPIVMSASVKVQTFGFSPSELDLSATHNTTEERVCAMLGLPAGVAGFGSGNETTKVGATLRELVKLAWTGCVLPLQRSIACELTRSLLPEFDKNENAEAYFDTSEVEALQPNRLELAQACREEYEGGMATRGEVRGKLNYDVTEADNVFATPFNVILSDRKEGVPPPEPTPPPLATGILPPPAAGAKGAKRLTHQQARILRAKEAAFKRFEPVLRKRVQGIFDHMGIEAERAWNQIDKGAGDALRIEALFNQIDIPRYSAELRGIFASHYVAVHNDNVGTLAGMGISMNLPDAVQMEIYSAGGSRAGLVDLNEAARSRALRVIEQAREDGLGVPETARMLRDAIPGGPFLSPKTRAEVIARTETRYAQTTSSLRAYSTIDGVSAVMMIDGRLGPTDEDCERLNGQHVTFSEAQRLIDQEHPNGTRDMVPVFGQEA